MVFIALVIFVERIIDDVDFIEGNVIFIVNDAFGGLRNGDDFVG